MASIKIFAVLLLTTMIGTVFARPGYGSYIGHHTPISYSSYSYPHSIYSYPSYGYGHGLYSSSYSYPSYGYGYGNHYGYGGWLGSYW